MPRIRKRSFQTTPTELHHGTVEKLACPLALPKRSLHGFSNKRRTGNSEAPQLYESYHCTSSWSLNGSQAIVGKRMNARIATNSIQENSARLFRNPNDL